MADYCLTKPCDACGKRIQGANWYCPKCKICLCFFCGTEIMVKQGKLSPKCPMCGEELQ